MDAWPERQVPRIWRKGVFRQHALFGAEVFRDENLDVVIYINELGNIAVMATK